MTGPRVLVLLSGLPRAGKTSLADALVQHGFTHVPLDRYITAPPAGTTFLRWVDEPTCIDWPLVTAHLARLGAGDEVTAPAPVGMTWGAGGMVAERPGSGRVRHMVPGDLGDAVPGCHAFALDPAGRPSLRVFVRTPRAVVAERIAGRAVAGDEVEATLNRHLSPGWRRIERYEDDADLVVDGDGEQAGAVRTILSALSAS